MNNWISLKLRKNLKTKIEISYNNIVKIKLLNRLIRKKIY